jgi:ABC-type uncharacterized transport system ATPase subunit
MDEPTSVLTPQEVEILFATLRKLTSEGTAILYISHKLEEIRALCDAATILRHGQNVGTCVPAQTSAREMAEMMVGTLLRPRTRRARTGEVALEVDGLVAARALGLRHAPARYHLHAQAGRNPRAGRRRGQRAG